MRMIRLGILGSGTGSNMLALLEAIRLGNLKAEVMLVMSDVADAKILDHARNAGIATEWIDCQGYTSRFPEDVQRQTAQRLHEAGVDVVCLAGFMRLIKPVFLSLFPERVMNIHPSLLPKFPGMQAWKQALVAGEKEAGCTVHFVDAGMDTGPIILQAKVPVHEDDDEQTLHKRIQQQEHIIYPQAVRLMAARLGFPS